MHKKDRILIVEDDKAISLALQKRLTELEFEVVAFDSFEACQNGVIFDRDFFLAILDLYLPDSQDGQIIDFILSLNIPVLVLSTVLDDNIRDMMISKNVIDYVIKGGEDDIEYVVSFLNRLRKNRDKKALIIDDSKTYQEIFKNHLQSLMFKTICTNDAQEGIELLRQDKDIILCIIDYHMPKINGLEFTKIARKLKKMDELAIIAITGWGSNDIMAKFLKLGANGYLNKPFTKEDFNFKIMGILFYFDIFETLKQININLEQKVREELEKRQQNEQMLIHQSKLAAMGEMLNAIAHQWRQPLNALGIITQSIEDDVMHDEHLRKRISNKIQKAMEFIHYMSKTINDFRNFFKQDKERVLFDVGMVIKEIISLFKPQIENYGIQIEIDEKDKVSIKGYKNEYKQAILNIISNAIYQLKSKKGGKIEIIVFKEDDKSKVIISDNGGGIPHEIIDRVFEPYFSTKPEGEGSGIGLYMTKVIIEKNMEGKVVAKNSDVGAVFEVVV